MIHTYPYDFVAGHIIAIAGRLRLLIDTGAPSSVADSSPIVFAGGSFPVKRNFMGVSPESLSTSIGTSINGLVGADILNRYDVRIDPHESTLTMTDEELALEGVCISLDSFMDIPIIEAVVAQSEVRMFFDTGAKLSYLDADITSRLQPVGTENDFYPGVGDFSTEVYNVPVTLGSEAIVLRVGNLPDLLQMTLMMANTSGIIGTALLQTYKIVYAPRRGILALQRISR